MRLRNTVHPLSSAILARAAHYFRKSRQQQHTGCVLELLIRHVGTWPAFCGRQIQDNSTHNCKCMITFSIEILLKNLFNEIHVILLLINLFLFLIYIIVRALYQFLLELCNQ